MHHLGIFAEGPASRMQLKVAGDPHFVAQAGPLLHTTCKLPSCDGGIRW